MSTEAHRDRVNHLIDDYVNAVRLDLRERWKKWPLNLAKKEMHEVIGAILARQVSLATSLALAPAIWNGHVAPMILRSMIDAYITLAWILKDPENRSLQFIKHGLGQAKLGVEHRKRQLTEQDLDPKDDPMVKATEQWINQQQLAALTEVNLGAWSGLDTRKMADDANCLDLYNFAYTPFSSVVHNTWQHISLYNLELCTNPLHRYHKVPVDRQMMLEIDFVYRAAKYVDKSFRLFEQHISSTSNRKSAFQILADGLDQLSVAADQGGGLQEEGATS